MIFIIAEIGINHNGDLNIAKKLIEIAAKSGFNAVKFQKRDIYSVYSKDFLKESRESPWGKTQEDQKKGLEFSLEQYREIDKFCKNLKIDWFASAWDINSLKFLDNFDLKYNKIASAMTADLEFVEKVAERKKYTFISTAMTSEDQIDKIADIFKSKKCSFELMHCVATYPLKPENANLKRILSLKNKFNCNVGYSGHEGGVVISLAALGMGITSLERHITLDRAMYGSDQAASLEVSGMYDLVSAIRKAELALKKNGNIDDITDEEKKISNKLRAHIKNYKLYKAN
jgi:N-acetylneuraminate synthase